MRLTRSLIEQIDSASGSSKIREIEMAVDTVVNHYDPAYAVQFWNDMTLYGLKEAIMYLDGFIKSQGGKSYDHADEFTDLSRIREELEAAATLFTKRSPLKWGGRAFAL